MEEIFGDDLIAVAVFGSFARGTAEFPGSDIDLLIVLEGIENLSFGKRLKLTVQAEDKLSNSREYAKFKDVFGCHPSIQEVILTPEELKAHPPILLDLTTDIKGFKQKRGPAMYGYEAELIPASVIFSREDAEEAFASTEEVFDACNRLIEEISGEKLENPD